MASGQKSHKRGPWSQAEDNHLMSLVASNGPLNWVRIAGYLGSRTPKQCRERFHQNLKPSLNHEPISAAEGEAIERMVGELGKRWAEIARRLSNRSDNAVKNWWNGSQNRRKRGDRRKPSFSGPGMVSHHHQQPLSPPQLHLVHRQRHDFGHPQELGLGHGHGGLGPHAHFNLHHNHHHHNYDVRHEPHYPSVPMSHADPRDAVPRTLPPLTRTTGLPGPLSPAFPRHYVDAPLPSPSALSPGAESIDNAPSLTSDNGSCYSTSPRESNRDLATDMSLPPLKNVHSQYSARDSLSPTVKLPSLSSLTSPTFPGSSGDGKDPFRQSIQNLYAEDSHSPKPQSPLHQNLPALRQPVSPQTANFRHDARGNAGHDRIDIADLCS